MSAPTLQEKLRYFGALNDADVCVEAADELDRLRDENETLLQDKARIDWLELIIRDGSCASFINDMVFATQKVGAFWGYPSLRTIMDGLREQASPELQEVAGVRKRRNK
jgi:hypothetical protein